jgi:hypothetical protein
MKGILLFASNPSRSTNRVNRSLAMAQVEIYSPSPEYPVARAAQALAPRVLRQNTL